MNECIAKFKLSYYENTKKAFCNLKLLTNRIIFSVNAVIFSESTSYCEATVRVKPRFACQELGLTTSHFKFFKKTKCPGLIITDCTLSTQVWKFNLAEK